MQIDSIKLELYAALALIAFIDGSVGRYLYPNSPFPASSIPLMLITAIAVQIYLIHIHVIALNFVPDKFTIPTSL